MKNCFKTLTAAISIFVFLLIISVILSFVLLKLDNRSNVKDDSGEYIINLLNERYAALLLEKNKSVEDQLSLLREKQKSTVNIEEYKKIENALLSLKKEKEANDAEYRKAMIIKEEYDKIRRMVIESMKDFPKDLSDLKDENVVKNRDNNDATSDNLKNTVSDSTIITDENSLEKESMTNLLKYLDGKNEKISKDGVVFDSLKNIYAKLYKNLDERDKSIKRLKYNLNLAEINNSLLFEYLPDVKGIFIESDGKLDIKLNPGLKWSNGIYVVYDGRGDKKRVVSKVEIIRNNDDSFTINKIMPYQLPINGSWF